MPKRTEKVKPYWKSKDGRGRLYLGDCISTLKLLPPRSVDLVFADPPFNLDLGYDVYEDRKSVHEYLKWTGEWLEGVRRVIKPAGSVWVAIGAHLQAEVKMRIDHAGFRWRNTVVWHYTFGPAQKSNFTPSWVALHYHIASPNGWTWNPEAVRVPSARQLKYGDRRANPSGKVPDNVWALLPREEDRLFDPSSNAWLMSRVCGTFKERTGHVCQMGLGIMERIIRACSQEGDTVLDPFLGSGTTAVAARNLDRKYIGIELSRDYLDRYCIPRLDGNV
jgi:site-specific DNA-methyltransferase (adenine-specific)